MTICQLKMFIYSTINSIFLYQISFQIKAMVRMVRMVCARVCNKIMYLVFVPCNSDISKHPAQRSKLLGDCSLVFGHPTAPPHLLAQPVEVVLFFTHPLRPSFEIPYPVKSMASGRFQRVLCLYLRWFASKRKTEHTIGKSVARSFESMSSFISRSGFSSERKQKVHLVRNALHLAQSSRTLVSVATSINK